MSSSGPTQPEDDNPVPVIEEDLSDIQVQRLSCPGILPNYTRVVPNSSNSSTSTKSSNATTKPKPKPAPHFTFKPLASLGPR